MKHQHGERRETLWWALLDGGKSLVKAGTGTKVCAPPEGEAGTAGLLLLSPSVHAPLPSHVLPSPHVTPAAAGNQKQVLFSHLPGGSRQSLGGAQLLGHGSARKHREEAL